LSNEVEIQQFQPILENSRELESLEGLDGYAYLRALAGQIDRPGGPDAARGPPVGQRCAKRQFVQKNVRQIGKDSNSKRMSMHIKYNMRSDNTLRKCL